MNIATSPQPTLQTTECSEAELESLRWWTKWVDESNAALLSVGRFVGVCVWLVFSDRLGGVDLKH